MEVAVSKKHVSHLGKGVCSPKGTPIGEAVDRLGDEMVGDSLAFCQG